MSTRIFEGEPGTQASWTAGAALARELVILYIIMVNGGVYCDTAISVKFSKVLLTACLA